MALGKCRECGTEVSDEAKTCPKCGINKPIKKTSAAVKLLLVLFGLGVLMPIFFGSSGSNSGGGSKPSDQANSDPTGNVKIKDFSWKSSAGGLVMILSKAVIENKNPFPVKDFEIKCEHAAKSGTIIDQNKKTIFDVIPANKSITLTEVNMGFIREQAQRSSCWIESVKRA